MRRILTGILVLPLLIAGCSPQLSDIEVPESLDIKTKLVICMPASGDGYIGTVTVLPGDTYITSAHLLVNDCVPKIDNRKVKIALVDYENDLAVLGPGRDFTSLSCSHLSPQDKIFMSGYAKGQKHLTYGTGEVTEDHPKGYQWAFGFVETGMSGGPVTKQEDPDTLYGIIKAKLRDGSEFQYVNGPTLCKSISNLDGAILPSHDG